MRPDNFDDERVEMLDERAGGVLITLVHARQAHRDIQAGLLTHKSSDHRTSTELVTARSIGGYTGRRNEQTDGEFGTLASECNLSNAKPQWAQRFAEENEAETCHTNAACNFPSLRSLRLGGEAMLHRLNHFVPLKAKRADDTVSPFAENRLAQFCAVLVATSRHAASVVLRT
jgi:hypothetical protein